MKEVNQMVDTRQIKFKVTLMGDGSVGKTSLVRRYVQNEFDDKYMKTLGTNVYTKLVTLPTQPLPTNVHLQVWDVMGQRVFKSIIKSALDNANGVILVCDLTSNESLMNLIYWIKIIYNNTRNVAFVFLGNKDDLDNPEFGLPALFSLSASFGSKAFLTSAKTGNNVEKAFATLTESIVNKQYIPPKGLFNFSIEDVVVDPMVQKEDKLINTFCLETGGLEHGMPIVQDLYNELNLDFVDPKQEELEVVSEAFKAYLEANHKDRADSIYSKLKAILQG